MNELLIRAWAEYFAGMWRLRESQRMYATELDLQRASHWREEVRERLDRVSSSIQMLYLIDPSVVFIEKAATIYFWPLISDLDRWRDEVLPKLQKTPSSYATSRSTCENFLFAQADKEIDDFVIKIRERNGLGGAPAWPVHEPGEIGVRCSKAVKHLNSHLH